MAETGNIHKLLGERFGGGVERWSKWKWNDYAGNILIFSTSDFPDSPQVRRASSVVSRWLLHWETGPKSPHIWKKKGFQTFVPSSCLGSDSCFWKNPCSNLKLSLELWVNKNWGSNHALQILGDCDQLKTTNSKSNRTHWMSQSFSFNMGLGRLICLCLLKTYSKKQFSVTHKAALCSIPSFPSHTLEPGFIVSLLGQLYPNGWQITSHTPFVVCVCLQWLQFF